jgi:hypothetical protein
MIPVFERAKTFRALYRAATVFGLLTYTIYKKSVKLSLLQAVEAHRVVRRRGSHIF